MDEYTAYEAMRSTPCIIQELCVYTQTQSLLHSHAQHSAHTWSCAPVPTLPALSPLCHWRNQLALFWNLWSLGTRLIVAFVLPSSGLYCIQSMRIPVALSICAAFVRGIRGNAAISYWSAITLKWQSLGRYLALGLNFFTLLFPLWGLFSLVHLRIPRRSALLPPFLHCWKEHSEASTVREFRINLTASSCQ